MGRCSLNYGAACGAAANQRSLNHGTRPIVEGVHMERPCIGCGRWRCGLRNNTSIPTQSHQERAQYQPSKQIQIVQLCCIGL
jgi:hypothetical protein